MLREMIGIAERCQLRLDQPLGAQLFPIGEHEIGDMMSERVADIDPIAFRVRVVGDRPAAAPAPDRSNVDRQGRPTIGSASCGESVCLSVSISGVAVPLKTNTSPTKTSTH